MRSRPNKRHATTAYARYAKKVAAKAKARERRPMRQMEAATWIDEPQTRPPLVLAFRSPPGAPVPADTPAVTVLSASPHAHGGYADTGARHRPAVAGW